MKRQIITCLFIDQDLKKNVKEHYLRQKINSY